MFHRTLRSILAVMLVLAALAVWTVPARAYLCPINPLAGDGQDVFGNPADEPAVPVYTPGSAECSGYSIGAGNPYPDYLTTPNWAYTPPIRKFVDPLPKVCIPTVGNNCDPASSAVADKNIPVAVPDIVSYPGSDYYVIELRQYQEQMHSDLGQTTLRGYVQANAGTDTSACSDPALGQPDACELGDNLIDPPSDPAYLGPIIIARKDRPVRILFKNMIDPGNDGDLFLPVDTTIMGSGPYEIDYDPTTNIDDGVTRTGMFSKNRATLHLHGGRSPWISDGTPHQWITPAGEDDTYPQGVSVVNVPDMDAPAPGTGAQTFYYTNQQSARLMFYHDHAWGITRLNVYAGEAAGYLITDDIEARLVADGIIPSPLDAVPLVIQDKTFVDPNTIGATDPTWNWGFGEGGSSLWWPHVYMPAQNPFDITGIAPMGRWAYGPYFWPATNNPKQPIDNPYFNPDCDPTFDPTAGDGLTMADILANTAAIAGYSYIADAYDTDGVPPIAATPFCQAPEIPSSPNPSWGAEAFLDTPVVNGTAYPYVELEAKPQRLRILNAAHDRFLNLQIYKADSVDPNTPMADDPLTPNDEAAMTDATAVLCASAGGCSNFPTEVRMLPAVAHPGFPATWPQDMRPGGVPDFANAGPDWVMIANEGGFLPQPVVIPQNPVTWNNDVTTFNAGNVNGGSLILGPAERADVIVDLSGYADGDTLILYNDAPAPWPALDPHYDYYTDPTLDNRAMGGAAPTLAGFGPNTRTIMQIRIVGGGKANYNQAKLFDAFDPTTNSTGLPTDPVDDAIYVKGVFQAGQDPIVVGQAAYNTTYNRTGGAAGSATEKFSSTWPNWGVARINDKAVNFVGGDNSQAYRYNAADPTMYGGRRTYGGSQMLFKAIQDEQGETFDEFGRMRAGLGIENLTPGNNRVNFMIQTYSDPSTENVTEGGVQLWKITHNGVDTHPIHFHLFDVQVVNRVGWDGFIRLPDPTELGWKETVRISPLEDTIVAFKPVAPRLPFGIPESYRPKNPATPLGSMIELTQGPHPVTGLPRTNVNEYLNFDWEYVWHCHILSHEENDMMRPVSFAYQEVVSGAPYGLVPNVANDTELTLSWTDPTPVNAPGTLGNPRNEIRFDIERSTDGGTTYEYRGSALANQTTISDTISQFTLYRYRVVAVNAADATTSSDVLVISPGFKIEPSATAGGTISPDTINNYQPGADATYTITPATDYHIQSITVDGGSVAVTNPYVANNYDFNNIQSNHTIGAVFEINPQAVAPVTLTVSDVPIEGYVSLGSSTSTTPGAIYNFEYSTDGTNWINGYSGTGRYPNVALPAPGNYQFRVSVTATNYLQSSYTYGGNTCNWTIVKATAPTSLTVPASPTNGKVNLACPTSPTPGAVYLFEYSSDGGVNWSTGYSGTSRYPTVTLSPLPAPAALPLTYAFRVSVTAPGFTQSTYRAGSNFCVWAANTPASAPPSYAVPTSSTAGKVAVKASVSPTPSVWYRHYWSDDGGANWTLGNDSVYRSVTLTLPAASGKTYSFRVQVYDPTGLYAPSLFTPGSGTVIW